VLVRVNSFVLFAAPRSVILMRDPVFAALPVVSERTMFVSEPVKAESAPVARTSKSDPASVPAVVTPVAELASVSAFSVVSESHPHS
jgi:hypothetical protein